VELSLLAEALHELLMNSFGHTIYTALLDNRCAACGGAALCCTSMLWGGPRNTAICRVPDTLCLPLALPPSGR
jgi:hypothetical protein